MEVTVLNRQRGRRVHPRALAAFAAAVAERMPTGRGDRLAICLVSDDRMRRFNREFRGRNRTTDVLSFSGDAAPLPEGGCHLGDIVISVPRAAEQARSAGHSLSRELKVLLVHGYLHLLGYDHETDDGRMHRAQRRLLRALLPPRTAKAGRP
jgi:probable rRNA maturation factor